MHAATLIREALAAQQAPLAAAELADRLGLPRKTVDNVLPALFRLGQVQRTGAPGRYLYSAAQLDPESNTTGPRIEHNWTPNDSGAQYGRHQNGAKSNGPGPLPLPVSSPSPSPYPSPLPTTLPLLSPPATTADSPQQIYKNTYRARTRTRAHARGQTQGQQGVDSTATESSDAGEPQGLPRLAVPTETLAQNVVRAWAFGARAALPRGAAWSALARTARDLARAITDGDYTLLDIAACTRERRADPWCQDKPELWGLRAIAALLPAWKAEHPDIAEELRARRRYRPPAGVRLGLDPVTGLVTAFNPLTGELSRGRMAQDAAPARLASGLFGGGTRRFYNEPGMREVLTMVNGAPVLDAVLVPHTQGWPQPRQWFGHEEQERRVQ